MTTTKAPNTSNSATATALAALEAIATGAVSKADARALVRRASNNARAFR
jgi:hypothetical protein